MSDFYITDPAAEDIEALWNAYIERGGTVDNADLFVLDLFKSFQNLANFSDIGTSRDYLQSGTLAFPHQKHIIFYRKRADGVDILNVLYGGMDLERYLSKDQPDG